jgi:hypothetical protein
MIALKLSGLDTVASILDVNSAISFLGIPVELG